MDVKTLYSRAENGVERRLFVCGRCGQDSDDRAHAALCCTIARCADCGIALWVIEPGTPITGRCWSHEVQYKAIQAVLSSKIVPYVEETPLYVEPAPVSSDEDDVEGRFHRSMDDLRKFYGDRPLPLYAVPCRVHRWSRLDAEWILEGTLTDLPIEDPIEGVRDLGVLQAFIERWNGQQRLDLWAPNDGQIVLVDDASSFRTTERIAAELRRRFAERGA